MSAEKAIRVLFSGTFAFGLLIISRIDRYTTDFFGDVLSITARDLSTLSQLLFVAFDPTVAAASGIPTRALEYLLLGLLGATIVVSIQTVGVIMVVALLVTLPAVAPLFTRRFRHMTLASVAIGGSRRCSGSTSPTTST